MSTESGQAPVSRPSPPGGNIGLQLARVCLFAPVVVIVAGILIYLIDPGHQTRLVLAGLNVFLVAVGFMSGVVALVLMRSVGRRGIKARALTGLALNAGLVVALVVLVAVADKAEHNVAQQMVAAAPPVYRFTPPEGFVRTNQADGMPMVIEAWAKGDLTDRELDVFIMVQGMEGELPNEEMVLPPQAEGKATLYKEDWNGHQIPVFRVPSEMAGMQVLTLNAEVPLTPKAIVVSVFGSIDREAELKETLKSALAGVEGDTNW